MNKLGWHKYGAFPRSGNHLLRVALEKAFPQDNIHWCFHRIEPIYSEGLYWTIVRNPVDCVSSWYQFWEESWKPDIEKSFEWYCQFMTAILDNTHKVVVIPFESAIIDIAPFIEQASLKNDLTCNKIFQDEIVSDLADRFPKNHPTASPTIYDVKLNMDQYTNNISQAMSLYYSVLPSES